MLPIKKSLPLPEVIAFLDMVGIHFWTQLLKNNLIISANWGKEILLVDQLEKLIEFNN